MVCKCIPIVKTTCLSGIVVNEAKAKESPCRRVNQTERVFSSGIVGALSKDQILKYCPLIEDAQ